METLEERASSLIASSGHKIAFRTLVGEIDSLCVDPNVSGWSLVKKRTELFDYFVKDWFKDVFSTYGQENNFALIAHGGQGRMEMTPCSDADIMLFIDSPLIDKSELALKYNERILNLKNIFGTSFERIVKIKPDMQTLDNKSLNTLLDARFLMGNKDVFSQFMKEVVNSYNYTDLLIHNINFWNDTKSKNNTSLGDISKFDIKHGRGGLRNFQAGVWRQAIEKYSSSSKIYSLVPKQVLDSAGFMLKLRYKLNLSQNKNSGDVMTSSDFSSLSGDERAKFMRARRDIEKYTDQVIQRKLRQGVPLGKSILHGVHGISCSREFIPQESEEKNSTYFHMLAISQVRGLPLDQTAHTIYIADSEKWMNAGNEFVKLFYERGKISDTLQTLADSGSLAHIWPAFAKLETLPDETANGFGNITLSEKALMRARCLDNLVLINSRTEKPEDPQKFDAQVNKEFFALSPEYQNAVKIASFTQDMDKEGLDQINVPIETKSIISFLIKNKSSYVDIARIGMNNYRAVKSMTDISESPEKLRALYVFSHASNLSSETKNKIPHLWDSLEELHGKTMNHLLGINSLRYSPTSYSDEGQQIVEELKMDFMVGKYASLAISWIERLCSTNRTGKPRTEVFYFRGTPHLGIASKDFKGLLSVVTGACLEQKVDILQANVFSPSKYGLALDFFNINPGEKDFSSISGAIRNALENKTYPNIKPEKILADAKLTWNVKKANDDRLFTLECNAAKNKPGILYAITRKLNEEVNANIYALTAHVNPSSNIASNYIHFESPMIENVDEMRGRIKITLGGN